MSYNLQYESTTVEEAVGLALTALQEEKFKGTLSTTATSDKVEEPELQYITMADLNSKGFITETAVNEALKDKVDKVEGKQLSTEDFTTELKNKLVSLSNTSGGSSGDNTALLEQINSLVQQVESLSTQTNTLRGDFDTLVSGNTTTAIETFNEIVAFLNGIEDSQDLESIIASIEQQIASKQGTINDLEQIRSNAALGATALQSVPSEYVTTTQLNEAIASAITTALNTEV